MIGKEVAVTRISQHSGTLVIFVARTVFRHDYRLVSVLLHNGHRAALCGIEQLHVHPESTAPICECQASSWVSGLVCLSHNRDIEIGEHLMGGSDWCWGRKGKGSCRALRSPNSATNSS